MFCCSRYEPRALRALGQVGPDGGGVATGSPNRSNRTTGLFRRGAIVDEDTPAIGGEMSGDRRADAVGGACDEGGARRESGVIRAFDHGLP